jgi:hypothetical protein
MGIAINMDSFERRSWQNSWSPDKEAEVEGQEAK